jgi:hypothetical protein
MNTMRIVIIGLSIMLSLFACRPAKKVQKISEAITKKDTTTLVVVKEAEGQDSIRMIKEAFKKVVRNKIDYKTFSAKVRVQYEGKEGGDEATGFLRMQKDSVIWISLRGALGIEGFRVIIKKDSVMVLNLLKKNVQLRSFDYLKEISELPFDFATLQDLIIGNPVFIDSNIVSYKVNANEEFLVLMVGQYFKHLISLDNSEYKILHSKLDDIDVIRNRTCDITFGNYDYASGKPFSTFRKISVAEQAKLDISLDFKQYAFGEPLTFPFNIPRNYKRL